MKKKTRRWLAALLAVIMTVGALPMSVLAAEPGGGQSPSVEDTARKESTETSGANLVKTAKYDGDKYTITLESWVTGEVKPGSTKPMDIVLLLDVSGSMADKIENYTYTATKSQDWSCSDINNGGYYYKAADGKYYQVQWTGHTDFGGYHCYLYYGSGRNNRTQLGETQNRYTDTAWTGVLYTKTGSGEVSKLSAMQTAVNNFIDSVAAKSPTSRISIVKFADDFYGKNEGNDRDDNGYNHTQIVKNLTTATADGVTALKKAVDSLKAGGATAADYGMGKATEALAGANQDKVVIMFTDGEPNHQNGFDSIVADAAIRNAKELKTTGAKIFTIGVFEKANPSDTAENFNKYMHGVSSNYPAATGLKNLGVRGTGDYYYAAANAAGLESIFETIADAIEPSVEADSTTVVSDTLSEYFNFAGLNDDGTLTGCTVKIMDYKGSDTWADSSDETSGIEVNVTVETVTTKGFDYAKNPVIDGETPSGKKLVVTFEITPNANATWTEGTNNYPTNDGKASMGKGKDEFATVESPKLPMTAYKVSYRYVDAPTGAASLPAEKVYLKGTNVTVEPTPNDVVDTVNGYTYTFDGWYLDRAKANEAGDTITNLSENTVLTGYWSSTANSAKYNVEYYLQNLAGDGYDKDTDTTRTREVAGTTGASVSETPAEITGFTFDNTVEGTKTEDTVAADGSTVLKLYYTRNTHKVTYQYTGTAPEGATELPTETTYKYGAPVTVEDVPSVTGYTFHGWTTTDAVISSGTFTMPDEDVTLTGYWTKNATAALNLGDAIKKTLTVEEGSDFGGETFIVTVTDTIEQDQNIFTGKVALSGAVEEQAFTNWTTNTEYRTSDYTFSDGTLTFKEAGTYTFTVVETQGDTNGMIYDTNENKTHTLTVKVTKDEEKNELNIEYTPITITNSYKEITPPDNTIQLGDFVKKTYTSTYGWSNTAAFNFTADITREISNDVIVTSESSNELVWDGRKIPPVTGSVTVTTGQTKNVVFEKVTLEPGQYNVRVTETAGKDSYVTYDKAVYEFVLEVSESDDGVSVVIDDVTKFETARDVSGTTLNEAEWVEFKNTYDYYYWNPVTPVTPDLNTEDHVAYIIGFTDGTIRPEANITRGEVATIFFRLLTDAARTQYWSQVNSYSDVPADMWCNNAISTLSNMGIINGYLDGTFRPNAPITRSELTKIAVSFFKYADMNKFAYDGRFPDVKGDEWYVRYLAASVEFGLIEGDGNGMFRPNDPITRAETCTIVNRTLGRKPDAAHLLAAGVMITWPDNSNVNAWYYAAMQEATNSHDYTWITVNQAQVENWTAKLTERDWAALERMWSNANSAPGGEVIG